MSASSLEGRTPKDVGERTRILFEAPKDNMARVGRRAPWRCLRVRERPIRHGDFHVDDGSATGQTENAEKAFTCDETKVLMKLSLIIDIGRSFENMVAPASRPFLGTGSTNVVRHFLR